MTPLAKKLWALVGFGLVMAIWLGFLDNAPAPERVPPEKLREQCKQLTADRELADSLSKLISNRSCDTGMKVCPIARLSRHLQSGPGVRPYVRRRISRRPMGRAAQLGQDSAQLVTRVMPPAPS
jgi:hypothetical protein